MCEPTSITLAAMSIAGALATHQQASGNAKSQQVALNLTESRAQMDFARQQDQQAAAGAEQMNQHARAAAKDMALFDSLTGEYGGGNTADRAGAVRGLQADEGLATLQRNVSNGMAETGFAAATSVSNTNSRLASIQGPSKLGTALQIGAAGVSQYGSGMDRLARNKLPSTPTKTP